MPELMGLGLRSEGLESLGVLPPSGQPEQVCLPPATAMDREQLLLLSPIFALCCTRRITSYFHLEARSFQQGDYTFVPNNTFNTLFLIQDQT